MPSAEERFRAKVKRRGEHDVWTGSRDSRGVGMVRIDGKLKTVQRAAWEFARGPLAPGVRVNTCAAERACVTVTHLSLSPISAARPPRRRRKGTGSLRELRPGVWEIAVSDRHAHRRRRSATIHGTRQDAETALARLVELVVRNDIGDLRVRELVGRYLEAAGPAPDDLALLHEVAEPALGTDLAALATSARIEQALEAAARGGSPLPHLREALRLVRRSYRWAAQQGWCNTDPTADIDARWLGR